jgi:peptidoglycan/LPS O-acetylase OafA/YrhL
MLSRQEIQAIDGLAILLIVFYHVLTTYRDFVPLADTHWTNLGWMGLGIFTFISGYKLMLNHGPELGDRQFLKSYAQKRFVRIMKPYFVYALLMMLIRYRSINIEEIWSMLKGIPISATHLWYLYVLMIITIGVLIILYLSQERILFILLPFLIILFFTIRPSSLVGLGAVFISGLAWARWNPAQWNPLKLSPRLVLYLLSAAFLVFFVLAIQKYQAIAIGLTSTAVAVLVAPYLRGFGYLGKYAFAIYILHLPIVEPNITFDLMSYSQHVWVIVPSAALTLLVSVGLYEGLRITKLNKLFE